MSRIGRQQLSEKMLTDIRNDIVEELQGTLPSVGGSTISVGDTQPEVSTKGTLWMETGENLGVYEGNPLGSTLMIRNGVLMEDVIPEDYDPNNDILFDLD